ncbi:MAG TPA: hypothetical protein VEX70_16145 [Pyrinomonadaceae bacterium]|nr:hypothetical protein [Pyrinomonadaceae bacterium]
MRDVVQWTAPAPLWPEAAGAAEIAVRRRTLRRPAILRFASDKFMDDYLALLENDPARLSQLVAQPETWRGPSPPVAPVVRQPAFLRPLNRLRLASEKKNAKTLATSGGALTTLNGSASVAISDASASAPLKLYQPAHQRFYLITACLVCGRAGLPDRAVNPARDERASFVVRRLLPPNFLDANGQIDRSQKLPDFDEGSWEEYALATTAAGTGWRKVSTASGGGIAPAARADVLVAGEEQLPLFPVNYTQDDGHRRRVLTGFIPVGKRENYMGAGALSGATAGANAATGDASATDNDRPVDPRMMPLWLDVTEPWTRLIERAGATYKMFNPPPLPKTDDEAFDPTAKKGTLKSLREQIQTVSWYILLDFAKYLEQYLPGVWKTVTGAATPALSAPEAALVGALAATAFDQATYTKLTNETPAAADELKSLVKGVGYQAKDVSKTLADALKAIRGGTPLDAAKAAKLEDDLESVSTAYLRDNPDAKWPTFLFPLADTEFEGPLAPKAPGATDDTDRFLKAAGRVSHLASLVAAALPEGESSYAAPLPLAAQKVLDTREGWFVVRCVYERPECGPVDPPVVSAPTRAFQLASFFDPDAPARPIRIAMPLDTSPAGLRKFDKNTAFMISDMLCGQIDRAKGMNLGDLVRSVLPWPLHKDLSAPDKGPCKEPGGTLEFGMICSLSIPIITICALLLLMIIVNLLDIIFRWLPYFLICFPLPGFSAKKAKG